MARYLICCITNINMMFIITSRDTCIYIVKGNKNVDIKVSAHDAFLE